MFEAGDRKQLEAKAEAAVEKALVLDPDLAEAHVARGRLRWTPANRFPHEEAFREYRRAVELNPNSYVARGRLAIVLNHIGLLDEAFEELQKATALNPSDSWLAFHAALNLLLRGKYGQALPVWLGIPPDFLASEAPGHTAITLFALGRRDEALARLAKGVAYDPSDRAGMLAGARAVILASAGRQSEAEAAIENAAGKEAYEHFHHAAYLVACAYASIGKTERALRWLEFTAENGLPCYPLFAADPKLDPLRSDPRFAAFLAKREAQWERYRTLLEPARARAR
jgi:tetratricopeptide (TPR) repeat protein